MSMNTVTLLGNLTRDPELRFLPNNTAVADFTLAVNDRYKDKSTGEILEQCHFIDCVCYGKTAENLAKFFAKGNPLLAQGSLRHETWEKEGQKRSRIRVSVQRWHFTQQKPKQPAASPA